MGKSCNAQVVNRLTPMFAMRSVAEGDRLYTVTPQVGTSSLTGEFLTKPTCPAGAPSCVTDTAAEQLRPYTPVTSAEGPLVPEIGFPGVGKTMANAPRSAFHVFTGKNSPFAGTTLLPLHRLSFAEVCDRRQSFYTSDANEISPFTTLDQCTQQGGDQTFKLDGIEGFVLDSCPVQFAPCDNSNSSAPQKLHRKFSATEGYALILDSQLGLMEFQNHTGTTVVGYVFPAIDTDNDGLIDGFEGILGTDKTLWDSDGDAKSDSIEYPWHGVQARFGADPRVPSPGCPG